jgi:hypothetical protein
MAFTVTSWVLPLEDGIQSDVLGITMWRWHAQWCSGYYHLKMAYRAIYWALPCGDGIHSDLLGITIRHTQWLTGHYHVEMAYTVKYWALPLGVGIQSDVLCIIMRRWHTNNNFFFQRPIFWAFTLLGCYAAHVGSCLPTLRDTLLVPPSWYHPVLFFPSLSSFSVLQVSDLFLFLFQLNIVVVFSLFYSLIYPAFKAHFPCCIVKCILSGCSLIFNKRQAFENND